MRDKIIVNPLPSRAPSLWQSIANDPLLYMLCVWGLLLLIVCGGFLLAE